MINLRSKDIIPNLDNVMFHILGCGAIGSSAALQIARMGGFKFMLYDMDKVEVHNIGVSQYRQTHIGQQKVNALREQILEIEPECEVSALNKKVDNSTIMYMTGNDIAVIGFDSMKSRHDSVEAIYKSKIKPKVVIDGRMGAEQYQHTVTKTMTEYLKGWYPDSEGDPEPCTAKATSYCSNLAGSMIANTIRKVETSQPINKSFSFHFPTLMLN